jgi:hypothetical protein
MSIDVDCGNQRPTNAPYAVGHLRLPHEFFFSLNVSLVAVTAVLYGSGDVIYPFIHFERFIYYNVGLKGWGGAISAYLAFYLYVSVLAALIFLMMRCFRRTSVANNVLFTGAGILAIGLAPVCWYFIVPSLYLLGKWSMPTVVVILIACFHYGFWWLLFWYYYPQNLAVMAVPVAGFCSWVAWSAYVRELSLERGRLRL